MAKLRHIAIAVPDPDAAAEFYCRTFDMQKLERTVSPIAEGWYLSDGTICLALLKYLSDEAAGIERGKDYVGVHHFGFWCDDLADQEQAIEQNGGKFFLDLPHAKDTLYYEKKFRDPNGIIFDISANGWVGAKK
jgi:methylmalonyl-CoA/ethylmalonyl-CoA epimerase